MTDRILRVALIGLGDIAEKAYLPVLAADRLVQPVLITRDPDRRRALQMAWRVPEGYATVEDALAAGCLLDAAFVHAATEAHPPIARTLIDAGIPTFVDKPLALSAAGAREVVEGARAAQVSLAVCFNRRFAPAYATVAAWPGLDTVVLTKNRIGLPDDPRAFVFDDYVHVVDTLRFLVAPDPEQVEVSVRPGPDGTLARLAITVHQSGRLGVGIMDRDSGQTVEALDAMAPGRAGRVVDLVDVVQRYDAAAHRNQPDNWASVAQQRGFVAMIDHLLASVRAGEVLDAGDALATHELCERVLTSVQEQLPG
ncbi:MAG: Gfo/Idh/MocA family oxidoreductase [Candidatus Nanopelagicales bacterium]